jgi:thiamine-phosphate pyrophosphorylase
MNDRISGLYAIADTHYLEHDRLLTAVRAAIDGGAHVIQYRDKSANAKKRERQARALASLCREMGATFLINDHVALAAAVSADGVHIGRDELSLAETRSRLGPRAVIGVSCYNELGRALRAQEERADYVAFGSFFSSRTKPQAVRATTELLREARAKLSIPIVAIGGITPENGAELVVAGADALAVIEGVFGQAHVRAAAARYARLFKQTAAETRAPKA